MIDCAAITLSAFSHNCLDPVSSGDRCAGKFVTCTQDIACDLEVG